MAETSSWQAAFEDAQARRQANEQDNDRPVDIKITEAPLRLHRFPDAAFAGTKNRDQSTINGAVRIQDACKNLGDDSGIMEQFKNIV